MQSISEDTSLALQLAEDDGEVLLRMPSKQLFGWLTLDELTLAIPAKYVDSSLGENFSERYRRVRTQVLSAHLIVSQSHIDAYLASLASSLASIGIDRLHIRSRQGHLELSARVREATRFADISARLQLSAREDRLRISCADARVYGYLETPAPVIAHRLLKHLFQVDTYIVTEELALGDFSIRPLASALVHCLPAAGWRLPNQHALRISSLKHTDSGLSVSFGPSAIAPPNSRETASLLDSLERFRKSDSLMLNGHLEEALSGYRTELAARGNDDAFLTERILSIASASRAHFAEGLELARQTLGLQPDFAPAHAAIAAIAVAQAKVEKAASHYKKLCLDAQHAGAEEECVRAALACARLMRQYAADDSTTYYELVLECRPGHPEASEALASRYRDEKRWLDLIRLIRTRISVTAAYGKTNANKNARDHSRLADIFLVHLQDTEGAHRELLKARQLDDSIPLIYENLAEVEASLGDLDEALTNWEFANSLHKRRNNSRACVLNLVRGGQASQDALDFDTAEAWFLAALEIKATNAAAMKGAAFAAHKLGNYDDAAELWQKLVDAGIESPVVQGYYAGQLACSLNKGGHAEKAQEYLAIALQRGGPRTKSEAYVLLAHDKLAAGLVREAIADYESAISHLCCEESDSAYPQADSLKTRKVLTTTVALAKARANLSIGEYENAAADFELTFASAVDASLAKREAALALLQNVALGEGKMEWVEQLIAGNTSAADLDTYRIHGAAILSKLGQLNEALLSIDGILEGELDDATRRIALEVKAEIAGQEGHKLDRAIVLAERAKLPGPKLQRASAGVEAAECWLDAGEYQNSISSAQGAIETLDASAPNDDLSTTREILQRSYQCMALAAWRCRSWSVVDESFTVLQSMRDLGEFSPEQSLQWGQALEKLGQYEKAAALLEPLVSAPPASKPGPNDSGQQLSAQVSRVLGRVYEELGQFARAAETEESFATNTHSDIDNESRAEAWYRAGVLHYRRPDCIDEAKRCLDEALQCVSSHLPALDTLEQIANAQEDHERLAVILGRKIAPLRKHPKRQRSLLSRLAQLQEHKLGRPDVAQQTYQRILDIYPDYRPALTFMEARAAAAGRSAERYQLLLKLAGKLPSDSDDPSNFDEYQANRKQALYRLAAAVQTEAPADPSQSIALFTSALGEEEDDKIWRGLQACYEQQDSWREVADVLGQRLSLVDEKEAATIALQRIEILTQRLGDYTTALIALRVAQQRHPTDEALANWKNQPLANAGIELEPSEPTLPTQPVPSSEAQLYRALANEALVQSRFSEAFDNFDKAIALAPHSTVLYEEYADAATTAGDYRIVAEQLLALSELPDSTDSAPTFIREHRGDLYLQLAQLNYDNFSDLVQARQYMRMAADAFGDGVRRATTLRQLATEAAVSGALRDATDAYEALGIDTLADHEALSAAKLYHRLSRGHSAVRILESLRASNSLSDEGRALLLTLSREQHHKRELADNLQHNLEGIAGDIVLTRLREALRIYQDILADVEAATHVRDSLRLLGDTGAEVTTEKQLINLAQAAEDAADNDPLIAVSLLSRALEVGYQDSEDFTDVRSHALLDTLRSLVQHPHLPERDSATREVSALVQSLLLASTHSEDSKTKITLLCEVAQLRRNELHDTRAAADALFGALSISPENPEILALLVPGLQESSDYALLVRSYELHLAELSGRNRIETLLNLGRVYEEVFRESVRSQECFDEAKRLGGDIETAPPLVSSYNMSASEVAEELEKAAAQEALGNIDDARAIFESAAATAPRDPRAFEALRRIYTEQRESTKLARVLEQLTTLSDNPIEKAALFYQRADLARTEFHDEVLVYEYLKEAAANSPGDLRYSHGLRTICMARGEWALAAELTYREIAAQVEDNEKGALYLELALIFDEKLLDVSQALVNYEQALQLDPDIRAAPRPLARLYELAGRHADAFPMYKKAAAISPDSFESGRLLRHAAMSAEQAGMTDEAFSIYEKVAQTGSMQDAEAAVNAMERIDGTDGSGDKSADRTAYDSSSSDCISVDAINARLQQKDFRDPLARSQLFYELACAYQFDLQDISAAVGAYEDALKADPEHVQAIDALANIAYQQRDWARAHSLYQQVPTTMSSLPPSIVAIRKGEIAELIGHEEAALEAFQIAQEFAPDSTEVLEGLVRCATRQGQFDDALSAQRSLVSAIPIDQVARLSTARLREAQLCEKLENTEQTILSYEKLLLEETDSEPALSRLVPLYLEMERSQDAAAALRSLIHITPTPVNRAAYLFQLGEIDREEHSDPAVAADSYFKAIDLDPGHIGTLRRLLHYYCVAGDFVSAAEMARDLKKQFALLEAETGLPLLHRAAIACDISGDHKLAQSIWESFGDGATEEIAKAVRQTYRIDSPPAPSKLAAAIVANCKGTGDSLVAIREAIERNALDTDQLYLAELMAAFDT